MVLHSWSESPALVSKIVVDIPVAEAVVVVAVVGVEIGVEVVAVETVAVVAVVAVVASDAQAPAEDEELQCLLG
jgi:hypothetical protein